MTRQRKPQPASSKASHLARTPPPKPPAGAPAAVLADQRRRLLSKHYVNKYRVQRGR